MRSFRLASRSLFSAASGRKSGKDIAFTPHGFDDQRVIGIGFELAAQLHDHAVEAAVIGLPFAIEDTPAEIIACLRSPFIGDQFNKQVAFRGGQRYVMAIW